MCGSIIQDYPNNTTLSDTLKKHCNVIYFKALKMNNQYNISSIYC